MDFSAMVRREVEVANGVEAVLGAATVGFSAEALRRGGIEAREGLSEANCGV